MDYKYLVVAALQEELNEFLSLTKNSKELHSTVKVVDVETTEGNIEVLTFAVNKMGMVVSAAKIMQVISMFNPKYTFFIGTCASLNKEYPIGSVLIPKRVFSYESGKYEDGKFHPDYVSYETSDTLRKKADELLGNSSEWREKYKVITDEDLCSGSAVIDDQSKVNEILENGSRKLSGLDMEAYSIAYINDVLKSNNELLVVKGISDYGDRKGRTEEEGGKELAKKNSANFAFSLIKYLDKIKFIAESSDSLRFTFSASLVVSAAYKLKVLIKIQNNNSLPVVIESKSFVVNNSLELHTKPDKFTKPFFLIYMNDNSIDIYEDICIIKPFKSINSWIPINDLKISLGTLEKALSKKEVGVWEYNCYYMDKKNCGIMYKRRI